MCAFKIRNANAPRRELMAEASYRNRERIRSGKSSIIVQRREKFGTTEAARDVTAAGAAGVVSKRVQAHVVAAVEGGT